MKYKIIDARETRFETGHVVTAIGLSMNDKITVVDAKGLIQIISKKYLVPAIEEEER